MSDIIRLAIVQAAPTPLNIDSGIARAVDYARRAAKEGAKVIAFGETWLGGYPVWLDSAPEAAMWDHKGAKQLHRLLMEQAVTQEDARLAALQDVADEYGAVIVIGAHERLRSSLYNAQIFLLPNKPPVFRRKLVPTHGERLIWARGDGSTLKTVDAGFGVVGGLICWEHWMPLARAAMHAQGELIHVAQWPTVQESYQIAARHYAFEGRCFVLSAGTILTKEQVLEGFTSLNTQADDARALLSSLVDEIQQAGQSAIIAPNAEFLVPPVPDKENILLADADLGHIREELAALDTDGHYSRPDVFELRVDTKPKAGVVFD